MPENKRSDEDLPEKLFASQIGSAESRAIARRLVESPTKAPNLLLIFVAPQPRGELGDLLGPIDYGSKSARIDGSDKKLVRIEGESQEDFQQRVADALPAVGVGLAFLFPNDDDLPLGAP